MVDERGRARRAVRVPVIDHATRASAPIDDERVTLDGVWMTQRRQLARHVGRQVRRGVRRRRAARVIAEQRGEPRSELRPPDALVERRPMPRASRWRARTRPRRAGRLHSTWRRATAARSRAWRVRRAYATATPPASPRRVHARVRGRIDRGDVTSGSRAAASSARPARASAARRRARHRALVRHRGEPTVGTHREPRAAGERSTPPAIRGDASEPRRTRGRA